MISEKLITNLTKAFDDEYYEITIEKVKGEGVDRSYEVLNTIAMEKNKTDIMKQAIETYLENGGSMEFLKHFEQN